MHGGIQLLSNGGDINIQFSKLYAESNIISESKDSKSSCCIYISNDIEENTIIEAKVQDENASITLNGGLEHLEKYLTEDKKQLKYNCEKDFKAKLNISSINSIDLGKLSWTELMRLQIEQPQDKPK